MNTILAIESHPQYSPAALLCMRQSGFGDEEILAVWNDNERRGLAPVRHSRKNAIANAVGLTRFALDKLSERKPTNFDLRHALGLLQNAAKNIELALAIDASPRNPRK